MDKAFEKILYGIFYAIGLIIKGIFIGLLYLIGYGIWKYKQANPPTIGITEELRFEHTLITSGSGWGKTQLLQHMILDDLPSIANGSRSVIVIDSQGDMIKKILNLSQLAPPLREPPPVVKPVVVEKKPEPAVETTPPAEKLEERRGIGRRIWHSSLVFLLHVLPLVGGIITANYLTEVKHMPGSNADLSGASAMAALGIILGLCLKMNNTHALRLLEACAGAVLFWSLLGGLAPQIESVYVAFVISGSLVLGFYVIPAIFAYFKSLIREDKNRSDQRHGDAGNYQRPNLSDRLIYVDPSDIEHPPALNLFDFGLDRIKGYNALEQETLVNGAIAMYEFMFGALLGAELTNRQSVIFRYLARLLMVVPNATIFTLMDFLEHPETARQYLPKLDMATQRFLTTQFFAGGFDTTREQILSRLWGVLSNPTLARMLSHTKNKLNLFEAMNKGSLILINTNKELLKQEGCELFGRFMIALLSQATQERAGMPEDRRTPCFVYIDEAHDYFDETLELLLNTARKYNVGITLAHQNLAQYHRKLEQTVLASTSTKWAGGNSADDAYQLAKEMNCHVDFIRQLKKEPLHAHFAYYARNQTETAIDMMVPLGQLERMPKMSPYKLKQLIEENRERICEDNDRDRIGQSVAADGTFALEEQRAL